MFSSRILWLVPAALTLVSFGLSEAPVSAQDIYPFRAIYKITATGKEITPNLEQIFISGESTDAPYGLTDFNGLVYSQTNFTTGFFNANTDPTTFGLQGMPLGSIVFSGSGNDKLFGTENATGLIDFGNRTTTASSTVTITGGTGRFGGAIGMLNFSQVEPFSDEIRVSLKGEAVGNGTIEAVPEPRSSTIPLSMGVIIGAGVLLRRRRKIAVKVLT